MFKYAKKQLCDTASLDAVSILLFLCSQRGILQSDAFAPLCSFKFQLSFREYDNAVLKRTIHNEKGTFP